MLLQSPKLLFKTLRNEDITKQFTPWIFFYSTKTKANKHKRMCRISCSTFLDYWNCNLSFSYSLALIWYVERHHILSVEGQRRLRRATCFIISAIRKVRKIKKMEEFKNILILKNQQKANFRIFIQYDTFEQYLWALFSWT